MNPRDFVRRGPQSPGSVSSSVSNLSGFIGPYITGIVAIATGNRTYHILAVAIIIPVGLVALLTTGRLIERLDGSLS